MRKITWILPTVCIVLAVLLSFGSILLFTPVLVNSYSAKPITTTENGEQKQTTVWAQNEHAHNLLLWQARHAGPQYSYLCVQYLLEAYYAPLSDWSYTHPEIGLEVYELAIPLYEQEYLQAGSCTYMSDYLRESALSDGGFRSYRSSGNDYGNIYMQYSAYQYLHADKETAKQTYLDFSDSTDDHYDCDRFLKLVTTAEKSTPEDKAWARAEALHVESLVLAEYEADKARAREELASRAAETEAGTDAVTDIYDWYIGKDAPFTTYSEPQIESKCQSLRAIAEEA